MKLSHRAASTATILIRIEPGLLILSAPLMLFPTPVRSLALLVVPALWIARRAASGHFITRSPLDWPLTLVALQVLVSLYATFDIQQSLTPIAGMVLGLGVYYALVHRSSTPRAWEIALGFYLAGGLVLAVAALFGTTWFESKFPILSPIAAMLPPRLENLIGPEGRFHPNIVAGALLWVLPLMLTLSVAGLVSFRRSIVSFGAWKVTLALALLLIGTILALGVFVLAQSREAFLGLLLSLLVISAVALRSISRLGPSAWKVLVAAGLVAIAAVGVGLQRVGISRLGELLFGASQLGEGALSLQTLPGRFELWSRALYAIQDFPFTGIGMGVFQPVANVLYPLFAVAPDSDFVHPHNHLLSAAVDLGLPGLVAYLALWLGAAWMLWRTWRWSRSSLVRILVLGMAGSLLAYFTYGITDAIALGTKPGVIWWYLLGLIASLYLGVVDGRWNFDEGWIGVLPANPVEKRTSPA